MASLQFLRDSRSPKYEYFAHTFGYSVRLSFSWAIFEMEQANRWCKDLTKSINDVVSSNFFKASPIAWAPQYHFSLITRSAVTFESPFLRWVLKILTHGAIGKRSNFMNSWNSSKAVFKIQLCTIKYVSLHFGETPFKAFETRVEEMHGA